MKPFPSTLKVVAGTALCCLLLAAQSFAQDATPASSSSRSSAAASAAKDEANSSPRERGRILVKRNPIASEYQVFGDNGSSPGADADGEGVDYRAFFPAVNPVDAASDQTVLGYTLNVNEQSGLAESGGDLRVSRLLGSQQRWAFTAQLRSSASDRLIEHYESVWQNTEIDGETAYFLDRPRLSFDEIYTRNNVAALQVGHKLSERHTVFFKTYYQDYFDNFYRNRLELQLGAGELVAGTETVDANGSIVAAEFEDAGTRRYFGDTDNDRLRQHHVFGGSYQGEQWNIDYSAYAHKWDIDSLWYNWNFNDSGLGLAYRIDDPNQPDLSTTDGFDLTDSSQADFSSLRIHDSFTRDRDRAARIDAERSLAIGAREYWIQTGLLHREKERNSGETREVYLPSAQNPFALSEVSFAGPTHSILDGTYELQTGLDPQAGRRKFETSPESFAFSSYRSVSESAPQSYTAEESVSSAYLLGAAEAGEFFVELGARFERTETATRGTVLIPAAVNDPEEGEFLEEIVNPSNGQRSVIKNLYSENSYDNFIPSIETAYTIGPNAKLRASWFQLLMRPQYFNIVDYRRISIPTRSISEGNPNLEPTSIDKLRVAYIADLESLGSIAVEAYLVDIENFFYGSVSTEYIQEAGVPTLYRVSRVENGDSGKIRGFEIQWQKGFDALPFFETGNASLAYTYSDSEARVATRPDDLLPVPERSEHLLKASFAGSIGRLRSELSFTYQSEALDDLGSSLDQDEYRRPVVSLGLNTRYALTDSTNLSLNLINLTDHPERAYEGDPIRVTRNQYSSWIATFGVTQQF